MDVDMAPAGAASVQDTPLNQQSLAALDDPSSSNRAPTTPVLKDNFREIQVKVHVRTPGKDTWAYQGRGVVTQEITGHSSRVVVRPLSGGKPIATFSESSDLQAEKRGNFVVIGCVDGNRVISWSLNALNNSETLRLLASIELACYKCKQAVTDPRVHSKSRRKIERLIKDDRRKRHRRRKDQEAMIDAFARQNLSTDNQPPSQEAGPPPAAS
ncbi:hypothetical protein BJ912DRAFT_1018732 [Pholiota molesta]|nr:hypothetical protein BJ912DRAFT_1018732 [Pholiota molesta]